MSPAQGKMLRRVNMIVLWNEEVQIGHTLLVEYIGSKFVCRRWFGGYMEDLQDLSTKGKLYCYYVKMNKRKLL